MEVGLGRGGIVLDVDPVPAPPTEKGHSTLSPTCRVMSIVVKRLPIAATAELLLNFVTFIMLLSYEIFLRVLLLQT